MAVDGVMDLDRLIQTCEFENKQYVKMIEKENQQTEALEKEIEEKQNECQKLEEALSQLDEDTKRAHKQFTLNRDNCDSLRKTMVVLMEHEVALHKKLNCLIANGEDERIQHDSVVKHYEGVYSDYMVKYKTFPLVKDIKDYEEEIATKEKLLQEVQDKVDSIKKQIDMAQGGSEVNFKNLNKFITKLAEVKLDTHHAVSEKIQFERELREIQNKNTRQEELENDCQVSMRTDQPTAEDSFGEDMSTMIGIFNNKSDETEEGQNTNNSAEIVQPAANLSLQSHVQIIHPENCVEDPTQMQEPKEGVMEISNMADISVVQSPLNNRNMAAYEFQTVAMVKTLVQDTMTNVAPSPSQVLENRAPISSHPPNVPILSPIIADRTSVKPVVSTAPVITNMTFSDTFGETEDKTTNKVPALVGMQPRTTFTTLQVTPTPSCRPQPKFNPASVPQVQSQRRSFTPKQIELPQIQMSPNLNPKIKCSVQSRPANLIPCVRQQPSPLIQNQEQRKAPVHKPGLAVVASPKIRAPPRLSLPRPPTTPEVHNKTNLTVLPRFVSPVNQQNSHPQAPVLTSPVSQQLNASPVASSTGPGSNSNNQNSSSEDVIMESPEHSKSNPTTPGSITDVEASSKSPFDLEKHLQTIDSLSKSPGEPMYSQRPMFDNVQSGEKSPGLFVQSFNSKPTAARSQPEHFVAGFSMNTSSSRDTRPQEMRNLFGDLEIPVSGTPQLAETSFMFGGSNETPAPRGSFLSIFDSNEFQTPSSGRTPQSDFSFNFGQDDTSPQSNNEEFSFSFGGRNDNDERTPSVFSLF